MTETLSQKNFSPESHWDTTEYNTLALLSVDKDTDTIHVLDRGSIFWSATCKCEKGKDHDDVKIYLVTPHWIERFCIKWGLWWIVNTCMGQVKTRCWSNIKSIVKKTDRDDDVSEHTKRILQDDSTN